jgi:hypothetical protein
MASSKTIAGSSDLPDYFPAPGIPIETLPLAPGAGNFFGSYGMHVTGHAPTGEKLFKFFPTTSFTDEDTGTDYLPWHRYWIREANPRLLEKARRWSEAGLVIVRLIDAPEDDLPAPPQA